MARMTAERTAQVNARRRERYAKNREKHSARRAAAYVYDPEKVAKERIRMRRKWGMQRLSKAMQAMLNFETLERERQAKIAAKRERARVRAKLWYLENKERAARSNEARREKNPGLFRHYSRSYSMRKLQAQPPWLDDRQTQQLIAVYEKATAFRKMGLDAHVDHIVPLQGKTVCGLHVPWNLEIVHRLRNLSKGNHVWPDMWESAC